MPGRDGAPGERGPEGQAGKDGRDGKDGQDGTLEALTVVQLDERTLKFARSDSSELGRATLPYPLDCGVYADGKSYGRGDGVTLQGSFWIAQKQTSERPGTGSKDWRLSVKRGADGREGKAGPAGPQGPKGERGSDGRDFA